VASALQHAVKPDHLYTVFSGQDADATRRAREFFTGYAPSSPSIAVLKDGRIVHMIERHQIEGRAASDIAADLTAAFDAHCASGAAAR
jgi:putative YphP/YqiW family bacilliredoxin